MRSLPLLALIATCTVLAAQDRSAIDSATVEGIIVRQGSTQPIQGVALTFTHEGGSARIATTREDGRFRIESLIPGRYEVRLARTGFVRSTSRQPMNLTLAPGQRLVNVRIHLEPTSVVAGRVVDELGAPQPSAVVKAVKETYKNGARILFPCRGQNEPLSVNASTEGEYRLHGLEPGKYILGVALNSSNCVDFYYPGVTDPADAVTFDVRAGTELNGIEIRHRRVSLHSVSFKVVVPAPLPTTGNFAPVRRVQILRRSRNGVVTTEVLSNAPIVDDVYKSPPLSAGSYELFLDYGLGAEVGHIVFDIVDRDIDAGIMVIRPSVSLGGRVRLDGGAPAGWAVEKVSVTLVPTDWRDEVMTFALRFPSRVSADGGFLVAFAPNPGSAERPGKIAEGRYHVTVDGLAGDLYLAAAKMGGRDVLDEGLLIDGNQPDLIELTLRNGGSVEGIVRNAKDEVVPDSQVALIPAAHRRSNPLAFKSAFTDQYGQFRITAVPPGEYLAMAWEDVEVGAWVNAEFLAKFETRGVKVTIVAGTSATTFIREFPIDN